MSEIFERQYQKKGFNSQRRYSNEGLIQFLAESYFHLPSSKRKKIKILELGFGSGANLWMIAKEDFATYGIDSSPTGIRLCRRMLKKWGVKAKTSVSDMRELPFKDSFFDAIVDVVSIQHISFSDHKDVYKEVYRCLKKGGRFYSWHLSDQSISLKKGGGKVIDKYTIDNITNPKVPPYNNGLICFLPDHIVRKLLQKVGFREVAVDKVSRTYNGDGKIRVEYLSIKTLK